MEKDPLLHKFNCDHTSDLGTNEQVPHLVSFAAATILRVLLLGGVQQHIHYLLPMLTKKQPSPIIPAKSRLIIPLYIGPGM